MPVMVACGGSQPISADLIFKDVVAAACLSGRAKQCPAGVVVTTPDGTVLVRYQPHKNDLLYLNKKCMYTIIAQYLTGAEEERRRLLV
jgi:hypothetical protein